MPLQIRIRQNRGATMALSITLALMLILVAVGFLTLTQTFSGDKQLANATDAGALAAAQQIFVATVDKGSLPVGLQTYGVDFQGNISSGNSALYNVLSYNLCAAYCLQESFIAAAEAADNNPSAHADIANACTLISALNTFACNLDQNIINSSAIPQAASALMASNQINNLPSNFAGATPTLVPGSTQYGYYTYSNASSDVSFASSFYPNSNPEITGWISQVLSGTKLPNGSYPIAGGKLFDINTITQTKYFVDSSGSDLTLALVPFQNEGTHLISLSSENYYNTTLPGLKNVCLPHNALQLIGETNPGTNGESNEGTSGANGSTGAPQQANGAPQQEGGASNSNNLLVASAAVLNTPNVILPPPTTTTTTTTTSSIPPPPVTVTPPPPVTPAPPVTVPPPPSVTVTPPPPPSPMTFSLIHKNATFGSNNLNIGSTGTPASPGGQSKLHTVVCTVTKAFTVTGSEGNFTVPPGTTVTIYTGDNNMSFVNDLKNAGDIVVSSDTLSAPTDKAPTPVT